LEEKGITKVVHFLGGKESLFNMSEKVLGADTVKYLGQVMMLKSMLGEKNFFINVDHNVFEIIGDFRRMSPIRGWHTSLRKAGIDVTVPW
jgi:hypothetical protein